ncbi:hypothetical protein GCM10010510_31680 [Streptomyces anandii JCM 4720]|nr:hypothetical protein GCM10010510_31680 [Streptomyces anandii JCM 4720]
MDLTLRARQAVISVATALRGQVSQDLASFDAVPIADPVRRASLRTEVLRASRRYRYADGYPTLILDAPRLLGVGAVLAVALAAFGARAWKLHPVDFCLHFLLFAGGAGILLLVVLLVLRVLPTYVQRRGPAGLAVLGMVALPMTSLIFTYSEWGDIDARQDGWPLLWGWDAVCLVLLMIQFLSTLEVFWQGRRFDERCKPYDGLALAVVSTTARIAKNRDRFGSAREVRAWCLELEVIAAKAEIVLALRYNTPARSRSLRRILKGEAVRIAEVFRDYERPLVTAYKGADIDAVVDSLLVTLDALLAGDRGALLACAPEEVPTRTLLGRAWARIWPPVVLIAAGIVLPMVPPVHGSPAELSLKVSLIALGVLKLVAPQVSDQVGSLLDKALPGK